MKKRILYVSEANNNIVYTITDYNKKELKIEYTNLKTDKGKVFMINKNTKYNTDTRWSKFDAGELTEYLKSERNIIVAYNTTDKYIPQKEYTRRQEGVRLNYRVDRDIKKAFEKECNKQGAAAGTKLENMMKDFILG